MSRSTRFITVAVASAVLAVGGVWAQGSGGAGGGGGGSGAPSNNTQNSGPTAGSTAQGGSSMGSGSNMGMQRGQSTNPPVNPPQTPANPSPSGPTGVGTEGPVKTPMSSSPRRMRNTAMTSSESASQPMRRRPRADRN